jgi:cytochrome c
MVTRHAGAVILAMGLAAGMAQAGPAGNAAAGRQLYEARCGGCHAEDAHRVGPAHRGVAGRKAGSAAGFDYSPALRASPVVWSAATLGRWLADPEALIPGQRMNYAVADPAERADIVAYLLSLGPRTEARGGG